MACVTLKDVKKIYPGVALPAVDECNIEIRDREFMVLVGPSGCGKSTTLRMVAGLEEITGGEVHIGGRLVNNVPPKDRDIAMVFQNYALYPHMTVYKNMAFGLILRKFPKAEIDRRVREAAEILGITQYLDRKPKALSGGQRQRVAVGRAIVRQPQVFLFDEPLSNLDAKMRVQMRTEISKLHNKLQATMIYVTHDQTEAMTMGDRICVMKDGLIQQIDEPLKIYDNPVNQFVAGFIGSPPMNFLKGELIDEGGAMWFNGESCRMKTAGAHREKLVQAGVKTLTMGVRPEDFADPEIHKPEQGAEFADFSAQVEVVEPMGSEIYIYLAAGGTPLTVRLDSEAKAAPGGGKKLLVNMAKAHYFHPETEKTIV